MTTDIEQEIEVPEELLCSSEDKTGTGTFFDVLMVVTAALCLMYVGPRIVSPAKRCSRACIANMRNVDSAIQQMLIEQGGDSNIINQFRGTVTSADIPALYLKNPQKIRCPDAPRCGPYIATNGCVLCPGRLGGVKECENHVL